MEDYAQHNAVHRLNYTCTRVPQFHVKELVRKITIEYLVTIAYIAFLLVHFVLFISQ